MPFFFFFKEKSSSPNLSVNLVLQTTWQIWGPKSWNFLCKSRTNMYDLLPAMVYLTLQKASYAKPGHYLSGQFMLFVKSLCIFFRKKSWRGFQAQADRCRHCSLLLFLPSCAMVCGFSPNQILKMFRANTNKHSTTLVVSKQKKHLPTKPQSF